MPITPLEARYAAELLDLAADQFSNHGCNDYELENTDENWRLVQEMEARNGDSPEYRSRRPAQNKTIYTQDFCLMRYLAHKLKQVADEAYD